MPGKPGVCPAKIGKWTAYHSDVVLKKEDLLMIKKDVDIELKFQMYHPKCIDPKVKQLSKDSLTIKFAKKNCFDHSRLHSK